MSTGQYQAKFGGADSAASATQTDLPILGIPDITDIFTNLAPKRCRLTAIEIVGKPASGDTVVIQAVINGTAAGPTATATNALPSQLVEIGPNDGVIADAGQTIAMGYTTTTAGTYTARDIYAEAIFELLDD